jgi:putative hemolysin
MWLFIFIILFLLLSAFFSGSEIAFISANKLRVELLKEQGKLQGKILGRFYDRPNDFIGAMLVGNNIALVVFTYLMTKWLEPYFVPILGQGLSFLMVITILITLVILVLGEYLPKTLFRLYANRALGWFALPLAGIQFLLHPITWFMTKFSALLLQIFYKGSKDKIIQPFSRIDLEDFVQETMIGNGQEEIDTNLFTKALHLKKTQVRDCMVPRNEIVGIDIDAGMNEVLGLFDKTKLSRILIYEGDIDNVVGYIHHQQMLKGPKSLKTELSGIPFVPEVMNVQDVMNTFIKLEKNIACVVDEFGGTAGVITLEDILEEIFGEIEDEHDREEHVEIQISETEWVFSGRLEIDYLNEKYRELHFPTGEYKTLSGYIVMTLATIPKEGDELILDGYKFVLEGVTHTRIETVRVIKTIPEEMQS